MLGFMAVSGLLGWLNIRGLSVRVHLPDEVYAGLATLATVHIENRKKYLPSFLITATIAGRPATFIILDRRKPETGSVVLSFQGRGLHSLGGAQISSTFPVNFFIRYTVVDIPGSFTVFPAPRVSAGLYLTGRPDAGQALDSAAKGYEGDLAKISDYRGGESLKMIHWRLSAKHEEFKVKELTATADEPITLELDSLPGRTLDERLSYCTFLINRMIKAGRPVGLKLGERSIPPAATRTHRLKLLGELAVYGKD
jgi:uncharacterized protein (DUF58 family)